VRSRFFGWLVDHRLWVLGLAALVLAVSVVGAGRLQTEFEVEQFFPVWDPARQIHAEYKESFPKEDTTLSVFYATEGALSAEEFRELEAIADLLEEVGLLDVSWVGNVDVAESVEFDGEPTLVIEPIVDPYDFEESALQRGLVRHRANRLYAHHVWNEELTVFVVHGRIPAKQNDADGRARIYAEVARGLEALELDEERVVMSGVPVVRAQAVELINADTPGYLGLAILLISLILYLFLRSLGQVLLNLAAALPACLVMLGLMGALDVPITMLSSFIPIIILVVGVCDTTHLLVHYRHARKEGRENRDAIVTSFSELLVPCALTSLTTAVGFFSLVATRIEIVVQFGLFAGIAVLLTFAFSMTLFPVLLSFVRRPDVREVRVRAVEWVLERAERTARRPSRAVAVAAMLLVALSVAGASRLSPNGYLFDDIKDSHPIIQDVRWVEAQGFGVAEINVWLRAEDGDPLHAPETLRWMEELQQLVDADPLVVRSLSLADFLKVIRRGIFEDDPAAEVLPDSRDEAAQLLFLASMNQPDFVEDVYLESQGEAQVILFVRDAGTRAFQPLLDRIESHIAAHPPPGATADVTGTVQLFGRVFEDIVGSFGMSLLIAGVAIFIVLSLMLRSIKLGLVSLVPNAIPLLAMVAVLGVGGWDLKPSTLLVFATGFTIAVDDTIHMIGYIRHLLRSGVGLDEALQRGIRLSGRAIVVTTLVVGAGFVAMTVSQFELLALVGIMTAVAAVFAVVADLFIYPQLLRLCLRRA
jgi:uncharacterized protein